MLRMLNKPHNGGAKDGEVEMSLGMSRRLVGVERVARRGLHARNRWRLPVLLLGILFANGRRTVTTGSAPRASATTFKDYYYFLTSLGRKTESIATQLIALLLRNVALARTSAVGDRRFAHQAVWAKGRRGGCPSQPDAGPGRSAVSVRPCLGHDFAGTAASEVGTDWPAAASDALCSQANDGDDSQDRAAGSGLPPSCSWRRDWWSGSFRS